MKKQIVLDKKGLEIWRLAYRSGYRWFHGWRSQTSSLQVSVLSAARSPREFRTRSGFEEWKRTLQKGDFMTALEVINDELNRLHSELEDVRDDEEFYNGVLCEIGSVNKLLGEIALEQLRVPVPQPYAETCMGEKIGSIGGAG